MIAQNYWEESKAEISSSLRGENAATGSEGFHQIALSDGKIYFEQGNYEKAVEQFQAVIDHPEDIYNSYAYWYQSLSYLKLDEIEKAKANLEVIIEKEYKISKGKGAEKKLIDVEKLLKKLK